MTDDTELDNIQQQIWQAAIANQDNPLGYRLLDAHFEKLTAWSERREAAARIDELERAKEQTEMDRLENGYAVPYSYIAARIKQLTSDRTGGGEAK